MITLEQVKLLETKVSKAIDTIQHLTDENKLLREKLEGYQSRIQELEVLIQQFKDDQGKIEAGIISALDRLNKFEDILELELNSKQSTAAAYEAEPAPDKSVEQAVHPQASTQNGTVDPDSDEAILAILEQEEKARQNTVTAHPAPEFKEASSGAELDIF
ncbi:MAG TPA: cell division protein ZapB [Treponema sp.]|nr:cell division protein ZapB [Treponema sp.]HRS02952.1 cell division protein ZapB [Treponema sp.]